MGTYVLTGASSGIGARTKEGLLKLGHQVVNIDYANGDIQADLTKDSDRQKAIDEVFALYPDGIDGVICNAGVGPTAKPEVIFALNYFAAVRIAEGLRPLLKKKKGSCVVTSSNSITQSTVRKDWVDTLTNVADEERVLEFAREIPQESAHSCYSSSKYALSRWVRRVSGSWAVDGLRINAVAPGNTTTPMTANLTAQQMEAALLIPIPTRYGKKEFLDAEEIANGIIFLSSKQASGINGVILFIDGGIDALMHSERI